MKKKFTITLIMTLVFLLGSFTTVLAADDFEIGTNNLNNTTENSAKIGDILEHPEKGWKRYDDSNRSISYVGSWNSITDNSCYNKTDTYSNDVFSKLQFNFTGNKIRLISFMSNGYNDTIKINIDNKIYKTFSQKQNVQKNLILACEINDLSNTEHFVEIVTDKQYYNLDAIDIDENGELKSYNENITDTNPVITGNRGLLTVTMTNGQSREYDLSMDEINKFIEWYNNRDKGNGNPYYTFNKNPRTEVFTKRTENLVFNKISQFDIDEYDKE